MDYTNKRYIALTNANIITMYDKTLYKSILVDTLNGIIEDINFEASPVQYDSTDIKKFDMNGKTILPGFIDAHIHLYDGGVFKSWLNLSGCKNTDDIRKRLNEYLKNNDFTNKWLISYGFTDEAFGGSNNVRKETLDNLIKDIPSIWIKNGGHSALINTKALQQYPVNRILSNPSIDEKLIEYENNKFTGVLREISYRIYMDECGALFVDNKERLIQETINYLISNGITCVHDNTFDEWLYKTYLYLENEKLLKLRINSFLYGYDEERRAELLPYLNNKNKMVKIIGSKYFIDGSINSYTAYLRKPYSDINSNQKENNGFLCVEEDKFNSMILLDIKQNLQSIMHCIGDGAIEFCLNTLTNTIINNRTNRPRLEHCTVLSDDLIKRLFSIKPIITYQQGELTEDVLKMYEKRLGKERIKYLDEVRYMLDNDIPIAFSSDWPYINPPEPFPILEKYRNQNHNVTIKEMIEIYTKHNAYAGYDEKTLGILKKGYKADFIIIDQNPLDKEFTEGKRLNEINIESVFINGKKVFG